MTDIQFETAGERMCKRRLRTENRRPGGLHYVVGQHRAVIVEEDESLHAVLSYVNVMGHAVVVLCRKGEDEEWKPFGSFMTSGIEVTWNAQPVTESFALSPNMIAALDEAEKNWERDQGLGR